MLRHFRRSKFSAKIWLSIRTKRGCSYKLQSKYRWTIKHCKKNSKERE